MEVMRAWCVRRVQHFQVQHAVDRGVHSVFGSAGHHVGGRRRPDAGSDGLSREGNFDSTDTVDRVFDGSVTGAAAQVSLERSRQVFFLRVGERRRGHDHPGGAEPTLKAGCIPELLLNRMEIFGRAESLDRGYRATVGAKGGRDAAVYRCSVEPHCARPAVPAVAPLLHPVVSEVPKKRPETLSRERLLVELPVVHRVAHDWLPVSSFRS